MCTFLTTFVTAEGVVAKDIVLRERVSGRYLRTYFVQREVLAKFWTMCVANWNGTIVLHVLHLLAWYDPEEEGWLILIYPTTLPNHIIIYIKHQTWTQWPMHLNLAPGLNFIRIRIGLTSLDATRKLTLTPKNQLPDTPMPWIWHCSPLQFGNIEIALSDTS